MKKKDLVLSLRELYTPQKGYGICKINKEGYQNVWFVVPPPPPLKIDIKCLAKIIRRAHLVSNIRLSWTNASPFNQAFGCFLERREAISSSQIEKDLLPDDKILIHEKIHHEQDMKAENQIIYGYSSATAYGVSAVSEKGIKAINRNLIKNLHQIMMQNDPSFLGIGGSIRKDILGDIVQIGGNNISDSIYNPAPPEHVRKCLADIIGCMQNWDKSKEDIISSVAVWHAHFEAIHPFISGNGRIGRILLQLQLMMPGKIPIYLSAYIKEHKYNYHVALEAAQKKRNYIPIIEFICQAIIASYEDELIVRSAIEDLFYEWLLRGKFRKHSSATNALYMLISSPVITIKLLSEKLGVSFQAASVAISRLEKARIVKRAIGHKRSRVFVAEEILRLSARNLGDPPSTSLKEAREILGVEKTTV